MYRVKDLFEHHGLKLKLSLISKEEGLDEPLPLPKAHRPGLSLAGYLKSFAYHRILVFGRAEMEYLSDLEPEIRRERLCGVFQKSPPAVIITRDFQPNEELMLLCKKGGIPLFTSPMKTTDMMTKLTLCLEQDFAPSTSRHGNLVEVFGIGVLIEGESAVGKSETTLGLIEKGHCLIADDIVKIRQLDGIQLEGMSAALGKHMMEVRGIGVINIAHLYGATSVKDSKNIDLVIRLQAADDDFNLDDRIGLSDTTMDVLDVPLPLHIIPVRPGRDIVLLAETVVLQHRLKKMGLDSAREFTSRLNAVMREKDRKHSTRNLLKGS